MPRRLGRTWRGGGACKGCRVCKGWEVHLGRRFALKLSWGCLPARKCKHFYGSSVPRSRRNGQTTEERRPSGLMVGQMDPLCTFEVGTLRTNLCDRGLRGHEEIPPRTGEERQERMYSSCGVGWGGVDRSQTLAKVRWIFAWQGRTLMEGSLWVELITGKSGFGPRKKRWRRRSRGVSRATAGVGTDRVKSRRNCWLCDRFKGERANVFRTSDICYLGSLTLNSLSTWTCLLMQISIGNIYCSCRWIYIYERLYGENYICVLLLMSLNILENKMPTMLSVR